MVFKKIAPIMLLLVSINAIAQDSNIEMSLNYPTYGVKIKNNFPGATSGFARGFMLSNEDGNTNFFGLGVFGNVINGVSSFGYGYLGTGYDNSYMTFLQSGNIGVGTNSPSEKLSVNGKVRAHEIKVETANWPDYVFAKDYQLPTLQETETHIKDKGHLPGIPSAAEVKANGIDLGEMNAKLLQKIEELTLHLIEQNKTMEIQQKTNSALNKKVRTQEIRLSNLEDQLGLIHKNQKSN